MDDSDESIRLRALDLLYGMVSKKNLMEIQKTNRGTLSRPSNSWTRPFSELTLLVTTSGFENFDAERMLSDRNKCGS